MIAPHLDNPDPEVEDLKSAIVEMNVTIESTSAIDDAQLRFVIRNDIEELTNKPIYKEAMTNFMVCEVIDGSN